MASADRTTRPLGPRDHIGHACMRRALRVAVVLLALLCAVAPLAAEEVKSVQKEIKALERSLSTARSTEQAAEQKVLRNRQAQSAAAKGDLPALKRKAVALQASLHKARKAHEKIATSLKVGRRNLRRVAGKTVSSQMAAKGNINARVTKSIFALEAWSSALAGSALMKVPQPRPASTDPIVRAETRRGDLKLLTKFDEWAKGEAALLKSEIANASKVIDARKILENADDGNLVTREANAVLKTLRARKKSLTAAQAKSRANRRSIEKKK